MMVDGMRTALANYPESEVITNYKKIMMQGEKRKFFSIKYSWICVKDAPIVQFLN